MNAIMGDAEAGAGTSFGRCWNDREEYGNKILI